MVTANVQESSDGVSDALAGRDIQGIAAMALSGAGGVILGQEVADYALPMLGFSMNPGSTTEYTASVLVKLATAVVLAALATRAGGLPQTLAGTASFGVLVSMGLDIVDMAQSGGIWGNAISGGSSGSSKVVKRPQSSPSPSARGAARATVDNGSFR